jgi:pyruvate dehydrogenase E1 component alpha subunit
MIVVRSPLRISLGGGGTDLPSYYRDHGALLQRGMPMEAILAYWGGDERGSYQQTRQDFPICVPIATQCLHAAGAATAMQLRQQGRVAVATLGDGGTSKADLYEAINLAGAWQLPLVIVINNNQWAISTARDQQSGCHSLAQKAIAAGIQGIQVDGNDIIAMAEATHQAIEKARQGQGATLIEALSYRLGDHTTADDARRYRSNEEVEQAWQKEPLKRFRHYLYQQNLWDDTKEQALLKECEQQVEQAVTTYQHYTPQPPEAMFDHLYETLPSQLEKQRQALIEESANE